MAQIPKGRLVEGSYQPIRRYPVPFTFQFKCMIQSCDPTHLWNTPLLQPLPTGCFFGNPFIVGERPEDCRSGVFFQCPKFCEGGGCNEKPVLKKMLCNFSLAHQLLGCPKKLVNGLQPT